MKCFDCKYYVPLRQLTSDEAKAVHNGAMIDVRGCCLGVCRFERIGGERMSDMTIQNAIHCMKAMICEEVCEECDYYGKTGTDHCEADAVRMAIKALEEQPRWIPCSERLPNEEEEVLVTSNSGILIAVMSKMWDKTIHWFEAVEGKSLHKVTAWMPLPEPYRGESE